MRVKKRMQLQNRTDFGIASGAKKNLLFAAAV